MKKIATIVLWVLVCVPIMAPGSADGAAKAKKKPPARKGPRIAHIHLRGSITEAPPDMDLFATGSSRTLDQWLRRLAKARTDKSIQAVALEITSPSMTWAQATEFADAVKRLNAVKPVYTHIVTGGLGSYLPASAGKELAMDHSGFLEIPGLGAELIYFSQTLKSLHIKAQIVQVGRFKGAAEPMTRTGPSEEVKQTYKWILDDLYAQLCQAIASVRGLKIKEVQNAIDRGILSADDARKVKFVDVLVRKIDWREHVERRVAGKGPKAEWLADYGRQTRKALDLSNPFALLGMLMGGQGRKGIYDPTIAIVHASGIITSGRSGSSLFGQRIVGSDSLVDAFEQVRKDDRIKAVVFRIDSPGGSAVASELIYQAVRKCARTKPVIVSVSSMAASGGYYLAVGGQKIIADPTAIIGSIGVVSGKLALSGLMEWGGVTRHEITRGKMAGLGMSRPWTNAELATIRKMTEKVYDTFVDRVTTSRGKRINGIHKVIQGRIFTARQAAGNGLIDAVGGFNDAVREAKKLAKLDDCHYITLPRPRTLMDLLSGSGDAAAPSLPGVKLNAMAALIGRSRGLAYLVSLAELFQRETTLTVVPYYVNIQP